jgi:hypothetical protein
MTSVARRLSFRGLAYPGLSVSFTPFTNSRLKARYPERPHHFSFQPIDFVPHRIGVALDHFEKLPLVHFECRPVLLRNIVIRQA